MSLISSLKQNDLSSKQTNDSFDTTSISNINQLPDEILLQVFFNCTREMLICGKINLACKKWKKILDDDRVWQKIGKIFLIEVDNKDQFFKEFFKFSNMVTVCGGVKKFIEIPIFETNNLNLPTFKELDALKIISNNSLFSAQTFENQPLMRGVLKETLLLSIMYSYQEEGKVERTQNITLFTHIFFRVNKNYGWITFSADPQKKQINFSKFCIPNLVEDGKGRTYQSTQEGPDWYHLKQFIKGAPLDEPGFKILSRDR